MCALIVHTRKYWYPSFPLFTLSLAYRPTQAQGKISVAEKKKHNELHSYKLLGQMSSQTRKMKKSTLQNLHSRDIQTSKLLCFIYVFLFCYLANVLEEAFYVGS